MHNVLSTANLIIAVQAIFLTIHFAGKQRGSRLLNRLVSIQTLVFGLIALNTYLILTNKASNTFEELANNSMWFLGPSMYLFVRYHDHFTDRRKVYYHLFPFLLPAVVGALFSEKVGTFFPFLGFAQMLIYMGMTIVYSVRSFGLQPDFLRWILPSVVTFTAVLLVNFVLSVLASQGIFLLADELLLGLSTLLGFPVFFIAYREMNSSADFGLKLKKYQSSHLSEILLDEYLDQVERAMKEQKMFLETGLTLSSLSDKLNIPQKYISQAINQRLKMSFSDYLLKYRLEQAAKDLVNPEYQYMSIEGIAQNAGFASLSRFTKLFKANMGITPGQFQKQHLGK